MKLVTTSIIIALAAACGSSSPKAKAKKVPPANLPVTMDAARQTALAQVAGNIEEEELEEEDGRWVYEFDIRPATTGATKQEVVVDATTGVVVKVDADD